MKSHNQQNKLAVAIGVVFGVFVFLFLAWKLTNPPKDVPKIVSLPVNETDRSQGAGNKNITIVEYADFQCPACKAVMPILEQVKAKYGEDIKFVFRHFPLDMHENAIPAAKASEAAAKQGKFFEMVAKLYSNQDDWSGEKNPTSKFESYAKELELDLTKFSSDSNDPKILEKIQADQKSGLSAGVNSTPSIFVNGEKVEKFTLEAFDAVIQKYTGEALQVNTDQESVATDTGTLVPSIAN